MRDELPITLLPGVGQAERMEGRPMGHYQSLQHLDGHTVTMAIFQCLAVLSALTVLAVKVFKSWG
jgi:hypothetical protein